MSTLNPGSGADLPSCPALPPSRSRTTLQLTFSDRGTDMLTLEQDRACRRGLEEANNLFTALNPGAGAGEGTGATRPSVILSLTHTLSLPITHPFTHTLSLSLAGAGTGEGTGTTGPPHQCWKPRPGANPPPWQGFM